MSGATRIIDGEGRVAGVRSNPLEVDSPDVKDLLQEIVGELRLINRYLSELTGNVED